MTVVCSRRCFTEEFFVAQQVLELQGQGSLTGFGMLASSFAMRLVFQLRIRAFRSRDLGHLASLLRGRSLQRLLAACRRVGDGLRLLAAFFLRAGSLLSLRTAFLRGGSALRLRVAFLHGGVCLLRAFRRCRRGRSMLTRR